MQNAYIKSKNTTNHRFSSWKAQTCWLPEPQRSNGINLHLVGRANQTSTKYLMVTLKDRDFSYSKEGIIVNSEVECIDQCVQAQKCDIASYNTKTKACHHRYPDSATNATAPISTDGWVYSEAEIKHAVRSVRPLVGLPRRIELQYTRKFLWN